MKFKNYLVDLSFDNGNVMSFVIPFEISVGAVCYVNGRSCSVLKCILLETLKIISES